MPIRTHPLSWPSHQSRTRAGDRQTAPFYIAPAQAVPYLEVEVERWHVADFRLTVGDGDDPAAALWFRYPANTAHPKVFACDLFREDWANVRAIGLTLERLRRLQEFGTYTMEQAIAGAMALPAPRNGADHQGASGRSTARRLFLEAQARFECALDWSARAVNDGQPERH